MYGEREINGIRIYNNDTIGLGTSMAIGNTSRTTREEHVVRWEEDMRRARGLGTGPNLRVVSSCSW